MGIITGQGVQGKVEPVDVFIVGGPLFCLKPEINQLAVAHVLDYHLADGDISKTGNVFYVMR